MHKITKTLILFFILAFQLTYGQENLTITGVVSDKAGPLPGVTVLIKGSTRGTETDFDGKFSIKAKLNDVLSFSFVGMATTEKVITSNTSINITMIEDMNILNEVEVVATGYDKINKKAFTGSAVSVGFADLKIDGITDISRMLEGKAAGVNIQNISGTFGAAPKITIRGSSSIFGNNSPLYVIDGVVQEDIVETNLDQLASGNAETLISSSIAGINANDIKKIDILKDASATSLYGARARNGVVVITTKSGRKESPMKISYSLEQTVRDIPSYSQYDILDSKENLSVLKELEAKGALELPSIAQARYGGIYYIMADRINTYDEATGKFLLENTPEAKNRFLQQYESANTNWFKQLFRQSLTQNHSLSLSGGGKNNAFYSSLSFFSDPGWSIAEKVSRLTFNVKNTFYLSDKLNVTLSSNASIRKQKAPGTFERQTDNFTGSSSRNFDINPFSYALNTSRTLRPRDNNGNLEYYRNNWADFNILEETKNNSIDLNLRDIKFQIDASYKFSDKITYDFNAAARYVNSTREHNVKERSNVVKAYNSNETTIVRDANIFLYQDPNNPDAIPVPVLPEGGIYTKNDNYLTTFYLRNSFSYNDTFNDKHNLNVLLGQEMRYVDRERNSFTGYGLQFDNGYVPFTDSRILDKLISEGGNYFNISQERERTVAFFGKASYGYDSKYIFSLTGRYDGSNRQGKSSSSRWLPTGSVSAKWNVSEEDFLANSNTISNLSLRSSYGLVATPGSATNAAAIFRSQITDRLLPGDRESYLNITELQNSELTWEKQYELNLGLDVGFMNNRVTLSADVYSRDIFDNIDFVRTSGIGGEFIKQGNNADVKVKGLELSLNTKNIVTDNFTWSSSFNFSYYDQEITKLQNRPIVFDLIDGTGGNIEGYPINAMFSFDFNGLDSQGYPTFKLPTNNNTSGGPDFQETENITDFLVYEGSVDPNISAGISNNFSYKNWNLNVLITGAGGNKIRLNPLYSNNYSDTNVFSKDIKNRWVLPGDENFTNIPVITGFDSNEGDPFRSSLSRLYNAYNYSTVRVADGDFVRMKNISLGYTFGKDVTDKLGLSSFNVKFQGTNLFLLYSDSRLNGQDPEFYNTGGVALPIRRQYTFSLNIGI
ncbi:SusC/RagA family TonB-linked outer membrane protein [Tenacibaculum sp. Bg11-29]|uniref:SusC/RagA family TonB-linked outer membrane protein n=1 Tax=Tenacibaculum sp. Bg11-29 TaxID=2058306 RepID=UPI000C33D1AE|nr:SusC/RagA family TonB-linked outer membrane protein [Tenacibaculum sp. Bg11-29]PKH49814.1 SusC/RagA family TonB-linked outer membrane protein [Tenacibaculum sp. Bg11-29]